jgi:hypothetical protein
MAENFNINNTTSSPHLDDDEQKQNTLCKELHIEYTQGDFNHSSFSTPNVTPIKRFIDSQEEILWSPKQNEPHTPVNLTCSDTTLTELPMEDSTLTVQDTNTPQTSQTVNISNCNSCNDEDTSYMFLCCVCSKWVHYMCTMLPRYQLFIFATTARKFQCMNCTGISPLFPDIGKTNIFPEPIHDTVETSLKCQESQTEPSECHLPTTMCQDTQTEPSEFHLPTTRCQDTQTETLHLHVPHTTCQQSQTKKTQNYAPDSSLISRVDENLSKLVDFRSAIREFENTYVERLVQISKENCELKVELIHKDLEQCKKDKMALEREVSGLKKQLQIREKDNNISTARITTLENENSEHIAAGSPQVLKSENCLLFSELCDLKAEISSLNKLLDSSSRDLSVTRASRDSISATKDEISKLLDYANKHQSDADASLARAHEKQQADAALIEKLREEVLSLNILSHSLQSPAPFIPVEHKKAASSHDHTLPRPQNNTLQNTSDVVQASNSYAVANNTSNHNNNATSATSTLTPTSTANTGQHNLDVLVVGNSHVGFINRMFHQSRPCKIVKLDNKTIAGAKNYVENCQLKPKVIILQVASNTLCDTTADFTHEQMISLLEICKKKYPGTSICVGEAIPRRLSTPSDTQANFSKVKAFNLLLRQHQGISIISHANLQNCVEKQLLKDNTHFYNYGLLVRNIKRVVNPILGLPPIHEYDTYANTQDSHKYRHFHNDNNTRQNHHYNGNLPTYASALSNNQPSDQHPTHRSTFAGGAPRSSNQHEKTTALVSMMQDFLLSL